MTIDLEFEKIIFLCNAEEGNEGLFDLVNELGFYQISYDEKLANAKSIVIAMMKEDLIRMERFNLVTDRSPIEEVLEEQLEEILSQPVSWAFSSANVFAISLTDNGMAYLNANYEKYRERVHHRWFGSSNPNITRVIAG